MAIKKQILPIIPVRGFVVFPGTSFHFDVAREKSIAAIEHALASDGLIFLTAQKDSAVEEPGEKDIYAFGTIVKIRQMIKLPGGGVRLLVDGLCRGKISSAIETEYFYEAAVTQKNSSVKNLSPEEYSALLHQIHLLINEFISLNSKFSSESFLNNLPESDPSALADTVADGLLRRYESKQELLQITDVKKRLLKLLDILTTEYKILDIENIVASRVKQQMDDNNHDYYLREQLRAIRTELGEDEHSEADEFRQKIAMLDMPQEARDKAMREIHNLERLSPASPESAVSRHYLEVLCDIPWNTFSAQSPALDDAARILEEDHYGMEKVKSRILEHLAVEKLTGKVPGTLLCLLGAPGVGKTSVARSIARAAGRKYVRISLGGVRDEAEIRGHRKTYIGAMPGRFISALRQAKTCDPLILLDEIDKISSDYKGDPSSALLEVLDGEQNVSFRDNFLETGIDLSHVMFIATANSLDTIPAPLLDRMEVIELSSYTSVEKLEIAKQYLIPKQKKKHGLEKSTIKFTDGAVEKIIEDYTREAGVRTLEREIASVCRKCATDIVSGNNKIKSVTEKNINSILGTVKYLDQSSEKSPQTGVVNGLAWTSVGGVLLQCEAVVFDGTGKITVTGKLGDVMKESAQAAVSYIRTIADMLGIDKDFYKTKDIHIHFPEGATPKDGPSAGITIATAVASALTNRAVRHDIAMTGEITVHGKVLPIGGLKEKTLAAYRNGIGEIIIPYENMKDLDDIPEYVHHRLTFLPVKDCYDVLTHSLLSDKAVYSADYISKPKQKRGAGIEYS